MHGWAARLFVLAAFGAFTRLVACVGEDTNGDPCTAGAEACSCTNGGVCDPGLTCASGKCVKIGGALPPGTTPPPTSPGASDAGSDADAATNPAGGAIELTVSLDGFQANSSSTGFGGPNTLTLDLAARTLRGHVDYELYGAALTGFYIAQAPCCATTDGRVVDLSSTAQTVDDGGGSGSVPLEVQLMAADLGAAMDGGLYIAIDTASHKPEIRGQIVLADGGATCPFFGCN